MEEKRGQATQTTLNYLLQNAKGTTDQETLTNYISFMQKHNIYVTNWALWHNIKFSR